MESRRCFWRLATGVLLLLLLSHLTDQVSAQDGKEHLEIMPSGSVQTKAVGSSILLVCNPKVADTKLISNMQWLDPQNRVIESLNNNPGSSKPSMYTELREDNSLSLFFNSLKEDQAGNYICRANYANTKLLSQTVTIESIIAITWDDAPENQYPILGEDFSIKCKVRARPSPNVDWLHNDEVIKTNDRYVIEPHALIINKVQESDDGIYTCRASVPVTGEVKTRAIRVEVHTRPSIEEPRGPIEVTEGKDASIECKGTGKPPPKFSWIKSLTKENLATANRFGVNEDTGMLTITNVKREDSGEYQCIAVNAAGSATITIQVNVIVKPKIIDFLNKTVLQGDRVTLECKAFGKPPPTITFRKNTADKPYVMGRQPEDDRIVLSNKVDDLKGETVGELTIDKTLRSNDGMYECIANNRGGGIFKNGHLTVEFPPSFESMNKRPIWSWDARPVNLTCIAESIPNATIRWTFHGGQSVENDPQITIYGKGPISTLRIEPIDQRYYTQYQCIATNKYGDAFHPMELRLAPKPADVQQVTQKETTATTITFEIVPPVTHEDLPITTISVQYKKMDTSWNTARNRTWAVGPHATYVVENLEPSTTYDFRFAAANVAGYGNWAMNKRMSTTMRNVPGLVRFLPAPEGDYILSHFHDKYNLKWSGAPDNGERIDSYEVKWCETKKYSGDQWVVQDNTCQIKPETKQDTWITNLHPDTYYKFEVRAHNSLGYGTPANITIKTTRESEGFVADQQLTSDGVITQLTMNVVAATLMFLYMIL